MTFEFPSPVYSTARAAAQGAIRQSQDHDEIVTLRVTDQEAVYLARELASAAEDWCEDGEGTTHYWGADWRVHLAPAT